MPEVHYLKKNLLHLDICGIGFYKMFVLGSFSDRWYKSEIFHDRVIYEKRSKNPGAGGGGMSLPSTRFNHCFLTTFGGFLDRLLVLLERDGTSKWIFEGN